MGHAPGAQGIADHAGEPAGWVDETKLWQTDVPSQYGGPAGSGEMARLTAIAAVAAAILVMALPSFANDLSPLFEGQWTGNGTIRPNSFDAPEKARCKVSGSRKPGGATLFSGRCATVSGSGAFAMTIRLVPGTERYEVEARLPDLVQPVRMRGTARGRGMRFSLLKPVKQDGRTVTGRIDIVFSGDASMAMTQTAIDVSSGERAEAVSMVFKKR